MNLPRGLRIRKAVRLGPLPVWVNFSRTWPPSWTVKLGRLSWNSRRRTARVDLPGEGVSWETRKL